MLSPRKRAAIPTRAGVDQQRRQLMAVYGTWRSATHIVGQISRLPEQVVQMIGARRIAGWVADACGEQLIDSIARNCRSWR